MFTEGLERSITLIKVYEFYREPKLVRRVKYHNDGEYLGNVVYVSKNDKKGQEQRGLKLGRTYDRGFIRKILIGKEYSYIVSSSI